MQYLKPLCESEYKINDAQTFASMIKNQTPLSPGEEYVSYDVDSFIYQHTSRRDHRVHHLSNLQ